MGSKLVYTSLGGVPSHAAIVARIYAASQGTPEPPAERECRTRTPEPHLRGEFPMTCYWCAQVEHEEPPLPEEDDSDEVLGDPASGSGAWNLQGMTHLSSIDDDSPCDGRHGRFCPDCAQINRWASV